MRKPWVMVVGTVLAAVTVIAASITVTAVAVHHERWQHFGQHASIGAGFAVLLIASLSIWPPASAGPGRWLRRLLVLGLGLILFGQILEAVGAMGYALDDELVTTDAALAHIHDVGLVFGPLGILAILPGLLGLLGLSAYKRVGMGSAARTGDGRR